MIINNIIPLEIIAIISLTMTSFITWLCLLWNSRRMLNCTLKNKTDSIPPKLMDLFNSMDIVTSNDTASLKNFIKAETSHCMQLKTVLHIINMKGIIGNFQYPQAFNPNYHKIFSTDLPCQCTLIINTI